MRTLILFTFLYDCQSWTLTAELERRIQTLEMRCYRRLLNISYKDQVINEEIRNRIQNAIGVHGEETETQIVWARLKIFWNGKDNSAGNSERWKKGRKTEEMGIYHQGIYRNGVWRFPEGSGRQRKVERYCRNVICGAPMTAEVKGLRLDAMRALNIVTVRFDCSGRESRFAWHLFIAAATLVKNMQAF